MKNRHLLRTRIGQHLLVAFLTVSLVPLAIAIFLAVARGHTELQRQSESTLSTTAEAGVLEIEGFLDDIQVEVQRAAADRFVQDSLESYRSRAASDPAAPLLAAAIADYLGGSGQVEVPAARSLMILDPAGQLVAAARRTAAPSHAQAPYFLQAQQEFYLGPLDTGPGGSLEPWYASSPIQQRISGELLGVLVVELESQSLAEAFRMQGADSAYLIAADGGFLVGTAQGAQRPVMRTAPLQVVRSDEPFVGDYQNYRAQAVIGAARLVPSTGWAFVVEQDAATLFTPIDRLRTALLLMTGGLAVGVVALAWAATRQVVRPIFALQQANMALARGDDAHAHIPERFIPSDEIGAVMRSYNAMTDSLRGHQQRLRHEKESTELVNRALLTLTESTSDTALAAMLEQVCSYLGLDGAWLLLAGSEDQQPRIAVSCALHGPHGAPAVGSQTLALPLVVESGSLGTLNLALPEGRTLSDADQTLLNNVAHAVALALSRAELVDNLRQQRNFVTAVLETAGALVVVLDREGRIVQFNRASEQTTGYQVQEVIARPFWDIFLLPEESDEVRLVFESLRAGHFPNQYENSWITRSGERRLIAWTNTALRDENGQVEYVISTGLDITEQRRAERALRQSEVRLRTVLTNADLILFALDRKGLFTLSEGRGLTLMGLAPGQVVGRSALDLYASQPDVQESLARALKGESFESIAAVGEHFFDTWYTPLLDEAGALMGTVGVSTNITERVRAEQALRESAARYRSMTENASDITTIIDHEGIVRYQSPSLKRVLGYEPEELLDRPALEQVHGADLAMVAEALGTLFQQPNGTRQIEFRFRHKNGEWLVLEAIGRNLFHDPAIGGVIVNSRDVTERVRAEQALRDSEARQRALLQASPDLMFRMAADGTFLDVQAGRQERLLIPRDQVLGRRTQEVMPTAVAERSLVAIARALESGELQSFEYELQGRSGMGAFEARVVPSGEDEVVVIVRDVTERKQTEAERDRLASILEATPDFVGIASISGPMLYLNPAGREMMGVPADADLARLSFADFPAPEDRERVLHEAVPRALERGMWRGEFTLCYDEGPEIPGSAVVLAHGDPAGEVRYLSGIIRDISERKAAEEALRESEQRVRTILEASPIPLLITRTDGSVLYANRPALELVGLPDVDITSQHAPDFYDNPEDRHRLFAALRRDGHATGMEIRFRRPDGSRFWAIASTYSMQFDGSLAFISSLFDIDERKQAEEELQRAKEAAEEANRAKSAFLATMSHELRTPLNAIIGYSEMLQEEALDVGQSENVPDLKRIESAGRQLLALINDVLDLSKIEAGKIDLYLEAFGVDALIHEVAATVQPLIEQNDNRLHVAVPEPLGLMMSDMTRVRQILLNLLSNAAKFTEQGDITLAVRRSADEQGAAWLTFQVQDTGIGMNAEQLERIFHAFSQADASTTRRYGGTGLGLTISRRFCQMLGGEIGVQSEPDQGSTFIVRLPAEMPDRRPALPSLLAPSDAAPNGPPLAGTPRALVVDDDPAARDLVSRTLRDAGLWVEALAESGETLERARELQPDIIILDVLMPQMNGWALLTLLKNDAQTCHIPVVLVTILDDRNLGLALGATDYLVKPLDRARLVAVVRHLLSHTLPGPGGGPVLIVEDDAATRELLRRTMEREGWIVSEADNGVVALARVAAQPPALILLDLMMPEMDGFQFLTQLRSHAVGRAIPVVVLTALELSDAERTRLSGSVTQILQKGAFSRDALLAELREQVLHHLKAPSS